MELLRLLSQEVFAGGAVPDDWLESIIQISKSQKESWLKAADFTQPSSSLTHNIVRVKYTNHQIIVISKIFRPKLQNNYKVLLHKKSVSEH